MSGIASGQNIRRHEPGILVRAARTITVLFLCAFQVLPQAFAQAPNIVMILTDDQSWVGTSVQMHPTNPNSKSDFFQTPRLEQLAAQGMRFSNAYSAAPVCSPTRAALLTGQSPAQLQMTNIAAGQPGTQRWSGHSNRLPLIPPVPVPIDPSILTLPRLIKQTNPNYVTGLYGKWHLSDELPGRTPTDLGYDLGDELKPFSSAEVDPWDLFEMADKANAFMEEQVASDNPFYLTVTPYAVHDPIKSRQIIRDKYAALPPGTKHSSVPYAAMTEDMDTSIGMILDKIQDLGIADNTYILFASDNGGASNYTSNAPLRRGKAELWDGGIRVPMMVSGPGIEANSFSQVPVTTVDLFATIADLAGHTGPLPEQVEGASLMPILSSGGQLPDGMDHLSRNFHDGGEIYWHWPENFGPGPNYRIRPSSAVRDGDYKLLVFYGEHGQPDSELLYNVTNDISETNNLAFSMPEKRAELRAKLDNYLIAVDASFAYDVKVPVTINWDAGQVGNVPNGWRSTIDLKYKGRETWTQGGGIEAPQLLPTSAFQPGLANQAFHFDGNDVMRRNYFQVGDPYPRRTTQPPAGTPDFNRSASMEFWVRFDSLTSNQILFESGTWDEGLSVTIGDADLDGIKNDVRFKVLGTTGTEAGGDGVAKELTVDARIDRFANPTADFVHLAAVFNDDPANRYAEVYINGALAGRVNGLSGTNESLRWDNYDMAGLGNAGGNHLGGNGTPGPLPFSGGLRGEMGQVRFYNFAVTPTEIQGSYNSALHPAGHRIASVTGDAVVPTTLPTNVTINTFESENLQVMHERSDTLSSAITVDALVTGGATFTAGSLPIADILAAGTRFSSHLFQYDPLGSSPSPTSTVEGSVSFVGKIAGILWDSSTLAAADKVLGSIGNFGSLSRGLDFGAGDSLSVSSDLRTLSFDLMTSGDEFVQFRVLTAISGADFNFDGFVDDADLEIWQGSFGVDPGGDADGDGDSDGRDFLIWQRDFQPPVDAGSTTSESLLAQWQQSYGVNASGDFDDDGDSDGKDFLVWQRGLAEQVSNLSGAVPEPSSFMLVGLLAVLISQRRRVV